MSIDVPNYRIIDKIGTGAGSTLYKAKALNTGTLYTIKHVKVHSPEDMRLIDQMRDEHTCGSTLDHPVLRKTFELRYIRRRLRLKAALLFMEYVDGETLSECGQRYGLIELLKIIETAADGLAAMHKGGFVHADLKPGNILIMANDQVKLIDFGQSSPIYQAKTRVQGTIDYMAPEQAARQHLDARTDVFGLGATLHRVLTGKPVATEMNQQVDIHSLGRLGMRADDNKQPSLEGFPAVVVKLITDCCQRLPEKRPKDMAELIDRCKMARVILAKRQETQEAQAARELDQGEET
jgi:serine/threonine protein kinase